MATAWRVRFWVVPAGLVGLAIGLSCCEFRPPLLSAVAYDGKEDVVIHATLRSSDAATIKRRELYARLTVVNCDGSGDRFPTDPPIEGGRIPGHGTAAQGGTVQITGRVPAWIYAKYPKPCVYLEGGGYFSGTVKSGMVPVVRQRSAGPNNSSKPTPLRGAA